MPPTDRSDEPEDIGDEMPKLTAEEWAYIAAVAAAQETGGEH